MVDVTIPWAPLPFEEANAVFRDLVPLAPGDFAKLTDEARSRAFAIAGMAKADMLATVHGALLRAIEEGTTLADFQASVADIANERGWTGWRLETLFRTNVGQAYEAGHWAQARELGEGAVAVYDAVDDSGTRPSHRAMDGKAFALSDPIWNTWWPINGFNCRCTVQTMSAEEAEARGIKPETVPPIDAQPDPGFARNAGKAFFGGVQKERGEVTEMDGLRGPADYGRPPIVDVPRKPRPALMPDGLDESAYWDALHDAFGYQAGGEKVISDVVGEPAIISDDLFLDRDGNSKITKQRRHRYVELLPTLFSDPYEIWLTPTVDTWGRVFLRKRYVQVWSDGSAGSDDGGIVILEMADGRWTGVSAFARDKDLGYMDRRIRKGLLLYGK